LRGCGIHQNLVDYARYSRESNAEEDAGDCKNQHELWKSEGPIHGLS
jgi:hypothetical protein